MDAETKAFIEGEFRTFTAVQQTMHTENRSLANELRADVSEIKSQTTATNGRVGKIEVTVAVLKFAVYTIGGSIVLALLQLALERFKVAG